MASNLRAVRNGSLGCRDVPCGLWPTWSPWLPRVLVMHCGTPLINGMGHWKDWPVGVALCGMRIALELLADGVLWISSWHLSAKGYTNSPLNNVMECYSAQCTASANKARRLIYMIRRFFEDLSKSAFSPLYGASTPHIWYASLFAKPCDRYQIYRMLK